MKKLLTLRKRKLMMTLSLLLALFAGGVNSAWAETLTANFNSGLPEGWSIVGSITNDDTRNRSGKGLWTDEKSTTDNYVITEAVEGTFEFYARAYNKSYASTVVIYEYTGSGLGNQLYTTGSMYTSSTPSWSKYSFTISSGTKLAIVLNYAAIDDVTYTQMEAVDGPALVVKDGSTKITSPYMYDFGLATAGTKHTFTLSNPGTAAVEGLLVSETGNFGATLSATSIAAGGEATLTVTMPEATANSTITISSTTEGINDFVINVSGTIRDPNKVYLDFADGVIPDGWTSVAIGSWASQYGSEWTAQTGYVYQSGSSSSYEWAFTSPLLIFEEGEKVYFETSKYGSSSYNTPSIKVQYSTDGNNWTTIGSTFTDDVYGTWTSRSVTIPTADAKYIRFSGWYINLRNIYGGQLPVEPKMVVTQPASLDFGVITEAKTKTFTIANTGRAVLEGINVTSSNSSIFAVSGAPTSLEAGESAEVTITMAATTTGALSSDITVSATGMEDVKFTVTGVVLPEGAFVIDFNDDQLPTGWGNTSSYKWSFGDGKAYCTSAAELTSPKLQFAEGDFFVIKATSYDDYDNNYIEITGSVDGSDWSAFTKKFVSRSQIPYGSYSSIVVSGIPATVKYIKIKGYYVRIDEIAGLTYAPVLSVTKDGEAVSTPATYDFGECAADATVTYNFVNSGAGTINITNVAITGDGAAAYTTNWTESVATPFDLKITRAYDATRTDAQAAVVTVTTTEGSFVINVTGTDKAANAPELAVDVTALDFGKLTADDTKTVTVTNEGTGLLTVNIDSDSEDFVVSPATLEDIAAGESETFTVTFKYAAGNYGAKTANITVTPTYDETAAVTIAASATAKDPNVWSEDFTNDGVPTGWEVGSNWTIAGGVAKGSYVYGSTTYLTTPKLEVSASTDKLIFDYKATGNYVSVKIQMSKDGGAFADYQTISGLYNGDNSTYTITGLEAGIYRFRFANDDYDLDNFEGFKLKAAVAHEAEFVENGLTIPDTGNQYVKYTASVEIKVTGTNDEELTAKFFIGETQYGEDVVQKVEANKTKTFTVTFTPDAAVSGDAYFTITNTDIDLISETKVVEINAALVLDEMVGLPDGITTGEKPSVVFKYTPKSGWNTIATPFALTKEILTQIFGEGYKDKVFELNSYDGTRIDFRPATSFAAGYPYLVYVETAPTAPAEGFKLFNVNITTTSENYDSRGVAEFHTTYSPIAAGSMTDTWYGVTPAGEIRLAGPDARLKGFRAYFTGISDTGAPLLSIEGEDATTGIDTLRQNIGEDAVIYDLNGRRVEIPNKGLYIINGKKVMIK